MGGEKGADLTKKGADLTTFGQEKKGADLSEKGADLTNSPFDTISSSIRDFNSDMNLRAMKQFGDMDSFSLFQYHPKCQVVNPGHLCDRAYT